MKLQKPYVTNDTLNWVINKVLVTRFPRERALSIGDLCTKPANTPPHLAVYELAVARSAGLSNSPNTHIDPAISVGYVRGMERWYDGKEVIIITVTYTAKFEVKALSFANDLEHALEAKANTTWSDAKLVLEIRLQKEY